MNSHDESDDLFNYAFAGMITALAFFLLGSIAFECLGKPGLVLYGLFLMGIIGSIFIHYTNNKKTEVEMERAQQETGP